MPEVQKHHRRARKIGRAFARSLARVALGAMVFGVVAVVPSAAQQFLDVVSPDPIYTGTTVVSASADDEYFPTLAEWNVSGDAGVVGFGDTRDNVLTFTVTISDPGNYNYSFKHADGGQLDVSITVLQRPVSQTDKAETAEVISTDMVQARGRQLHAGLFSGMLQQRRQMASARTPGTISINPAGGGLALGFAASTVGLTAAAQAANTLGQTVVVDDQGANFWIDGDMNLYARNNGGGDQWGQAGLVGAGVDVLVDKNLLVGGVLYGDWMSDKSDSQTTTGAGFLVGPYVSAEVSPNVFFDAAGLYGQSWNTLKFDDFSGDFSTDRVLARGELRGVIELDDNTRFRPNTTVFYMRENIAGYTVSNGAGTSQDVDADIQQQLTASAGGRIEHSIDVGGEWLLTPHVSLDLGMVGTNGTWSQLVQAGVGTELVSGRGFKLVVGVDGSATAAGARSIGASAKVKAHF